MNEAPPIDRTNVRCANCFFLDREKIQTSTGKKHDIPRTELVYFCKRFPPNTPNGIVNLPHPIVDPSTDWCGEFSDWRNYLTKEVTHGEDTSSQDRQEQEEAVKEQDGQVGA